MDRRERVIDCMEETGGIPEKIRVRFSDGRTAVYDLRVEQPRPVITENAALFGKWNVGYQWKGRRCENR